VRWVLTGLALLQLLAGLLRVAGNPITDALLTVLLLLTGIVLLIAAWVTWRG
jgi:hypothetical protein